MLNWFLQNSLKILAEPVPLGLEAKRLIWVGDLYI